MLWWVFCATILLSPVVLFVLLDVARNRYLRDTRERLPRIPSIPATPAPQLREAIVALEAQFLVAPLRAIHEAETCLTVTRGPHPAPVLETTLSPAALRAAFEDVILKLEESETAANHPVRKA